MEDIKNVKLVESFETNQCFVSIFETELSYYNEKLFMLISIHKNNYKMNVRYGNELQITGMKNTDRNRREIKNG